MSRNTAVAMGHRRTCGKCTSYRALQAWALICYSFSILRLSLFLYETEAVTHLSHRITARIENRKKKESFCICQASCQSPYICHLTLVIPWVWHECGSWCSEKLSNLVHYSENSRAEMGTWCVDSSSRVYHHHMMLSEWVNARPAAASRVASWPRCPPPPATA